jgi:hypothetical protein
LVNFSLFTSFFFLTLFLRGWSPLRRFLVVRLKPQRQSSWLLVLRKRR